jgi:DNA primase
MRAVLERTRPLAGVLWEREWASGDWSTPERRAQLQKRVFDLVARIGEPSVRAHYSQAMRQRLAEAFGEHRAAGRPAGQGRGPPHRRPWPPRRGAPQRGHAPRAGLGWAPPPVATRSLQQSPLVSGSRSAPPYREALLLRTLLNHPWLLEEHSEEVAGLVLASSALARLRDALLLLQAGEIPLDRKTLRSQLGSLSLDKVVDLVERAVTHKSDRFAEPHTERTEVEDGWRHALALHNRQSGYRKALEAAERDWQVNQSEEALARIFEIKQLIASSEAVEAYCDARP